MIVHRTLLLAFVITGLMACTSTPAPSARYLLPQIDPPGQAEASAVSHTLVVRPPQLANFLNSEGIVMQLDDITLNQAGNHRWAENLGLQLHRGLRQHLRRRLPDTRILAEPVPGNALQLRLEVDRFQGRHDGLAISSGQWQLRGTNGELLTQESFLVETALDADGYPALVRALGNSWAMVADQIAERIMALR